MDDGLVLLFSSFFLPFLLLSLSPSHSKPSTVPAATGLLHSTVFCTYGTGDMGISRRNGSHRSSRTTETGLPTPSGASGCHFPFFPLLPTSWPGNFLTADLSVTLSRYLFWLAAGRHTL